MFDLHRKLQAAFLGYFTSQILTIKTHNKKAEGISLLRKVANVTREYIVQSLADSCLISPVFTVEPLRWRNAVVKATSDLYHMEASITVA